MVCARNAVTYFLQWFHISSLSTDYRIVKALALLFRKSSARLSSNNLSGKLIQLNEWLAPYFSLLSISDWHMPNQGSTYGSQCPEAPKEFLNIRPIQDGPFTLENEQALHILGILKTDEHDTY